VVGTRNAVDSPSFRLRLPCEPASVPQARAQVRKWCQELAIPDRLLADVLLAVGEAAANAVRHSGAAELETRGWTSETSLIVCVSDHGRGLPDHTPDTGYGLAVIHALTESVEFEDARPGTRVTMRFTGTVPREAS
jgi:serine/threonine-protein kinase RsbW